MLACPPKITKLVQKTYSMLQKNWSVESYWLYEVKATNPAKPGKKALNSLPEALHFDKKKLSMMFYKLLSYDVLATYRKQATTV